MNRLNHLLLLLISFACYFLKKMLLNSRLPKHRLCYARSRFLLHPLLEQFIPQIVNILLLICKFYYLDVNLTELMSVIQR